MVQLRQKNSVNEIVPCFTGNMMILEVGGFVAQMPNNVVTFIALNIFSGRYILFWIVIHEIMIDYISLYLKRDSLKDQRQ
jgi:uncharacterized membrane protein